MPRPFDLEKHCGAPKKNGSPCTQPKGFGTKHVGEGCCHLHSPKTEASSEITSAIASVPIELPLEPVTRAFNPPHARPNNQNAVTHGLYARVLTGAAATRFEAVSQYAPGDILKEGFWLVHSRALGLLEGEAKFDRQSQTVLDACDVLMEAGELTEEFVEELRLRLLNLDVEKLARILNSTISMANAATYLNKMGSVQRQLDIAMKYLRISLTMTGDRAIRELGLTTIQELKLEAGLPVEEINELLKFIQTQAKSDD